MTKAKIDLRGKLPKGWWFETESAAHFLEQIIQEGALSQESIYKTMDKSGRIIGKRTFDEGKGYFIMCIKYKGAGEKTLYFELTYEEAITWLKEQGYLTNDDDIEEQLQSLILERMPLPKDPIEEARKKVRERALGEQLFQKAIPDAK